MQPGVKPELVETKKIWDLAVATDAGLPATRDVDGQYAWSKGPVIYRQNIFGWR